MKIEHRLFCRNCKTKEGPLMKQNKRTLKCGLTIQEYYCRPCNRKRQKYWYAKSPENKKKQYDLNRKNKIENPDRFNYMMAKCYAKKVGYRLVKITKK